MKTLPHKQHKHPAARQKVADNSLGSKSPKAPSACRAIAEQQREEEKDRTKPKCEEVEVEAREGDCSGHNRATAARLGSLCVLT